MCGGAERLGAVPLRLSAAAQRSRMRGATACKARVCVFSSRLVSCPGVQAFIGISCGGSAKLAETRLARGCPGSSALERRCELWRLVSRQAYPHRSAPPHPAQPTCTPHAHGSQSTCSEEPPSALAQSPARQPPPCKPEQTESFYIYHTRGTASRLGDTKEDARSSG